MREYSGFNTDNFNCNFINNYKHYEGKPIKSQPI